MADQKRKGAKSFNDIQSSILDQLNKGEIESANLTEWLAIDHCSLIENVLPPEHHKACKTAIEVLESKSAMQQIKAIGHALYSQMRINEDENLFEILKCHRSDSVRCWAAYVIGFNDTISLDTKLKAIKDFAADPHFGVREIAWMAVREDIINNLEQAISILSEWAKDTDSNIRRFASESTRPKGVWCKQIEELKNNPQPALPILEQLKNDESKYVQDSVANWLNDASKAQSDFVVQICDRWTKESSSKETKYIVKRALRTISKK